MGDAYWLVIAGVWATTSLQFTVLHAHLQAYGADPAHSSAAHEYGMLSSCLLFAM